VATVHLQSGTTYKDDWNYAVFLVLFLNGTVISCQWENTDLNSTSGQPGTTRVTEFEQPPELSSPVNFSAIATTLDGRLYGIMGGQILEYSVASVPFYWNYEGVVWPVDTG
jgi:hypothetical protein